MLLLLGLCSPVQIVAFSPEKYAEHSVLASGKWVKIKVAESGLYAITAKDASSWGFSNLNDVRIFGYGGAPISEKLSDDIPDDLQQVSVKRTDGKIIFYAQGPTTWTQNANGYYVQVQHPYSTEGYYFVTADASIPDKEAIDVATTLNPDAQIVTTFPERTFHELELFSIAETGRILVGEDFKYNTLQTFSFNIPGYVADSDIAVITNFAANSSGGSSSLLKFKYNDNPLPLSPSDYISPVTATAIKAINTITTKTFSLSSAKDFKYSIDFSYSGTLKTARLDYITVNYERSLNLANDALYFRNKYSSQDFSFRIKAEKSTDVIVWDITNSAQPKNLDLIIENDEVFFAPINNSNHEYVAFSPSMNFDAPTFVGKVSNQDIHGEETPDMIIISPIEFTSQAQQLANMHERVDSMRVLIVEPTKIYNEFSSGTPDAMAYRLLCKMFYDRGTDAEGHKLSSLLLFGDGTFDNRKLTETLAGSNQPYLLTWESVSSFDENSSYCTDDIFATLGDYSGANLSADKMSIGVGRLPISNSNEASSVVAKIVRYVTTDNYGTWQTNMLNVADDEDHAIHMIQADDAVNTFRENGGADIMNTKVYIDAFHAESVGGGRTMPDANKRFKRRLDEGVIWLNYTGHSSFTGWSGEKILTYEDVLNQYNKQLPFVYGATCDYNRFDGNIRTGGEVMATNPQGGAIAIFSATRQVYIPNNSLLNCSVAKYAFSRDNNGKFLTIGEFLRLGKNGIGNDSNRLRYVLFGDPAIRLKVPELKAKIETINGVEVNPENRPIFQGRQTIVAKGGIYDNAGNLVNDFNGSLTATLYDIEESVETNGYGEGEKYVFLDRSNRLAIVSDSVSSGRFSVKITIPSELMSVESFENFDTALLSVYAHKSGNKQYAMGSCNDFYIYGTDMNIETDTIGPDISVLALNSTDFKDGDEVNESPLLIAHLSDESGINFSTGGIGHNLTITIDDELTYHDVSSYFKSVIDEFGNNAGIINYPLSNLTPGYHVLKLKAWDVFNNSSERAISFNVVRGLRPNVYNVYTISNPAKLNAVFYLSHNMPDAIVTVTISVFDLMGREVWTTTQTGRSDLYTTFPITWNLCDQTGRRVPRGIYVYRATISTDGKTETSKGQKLAVTGD